MVISLKWQRRWLAYESARGQQMARNRPYPKTRGDHVVSSYLFLLPLTSLSFILSYPPCVCCHVLIIRYYASISSPGWRHDLIFSHDPICAIMSPHRWHLGHHLHFFRTACVFLYPSITLKYELYTAVHVCHFPHAAHALCPLATCVGPKCHSWL